MSGVLPGVSCHVACRSDVADVLEAGFKLMMQHSALRFTVSESLCTDIQQLHSLLLTTTTTTTNTNNY